MHVQANIEHTVDTEEFRFLLTGGIGAGEMNRLSSLLGFVGFAEDLQKDPVRPLQLMFIITRAKANKTLQITACKHWVSPIICHVCMQERKDAGSNIIRRFSCNVPRLFCRSCRFSWQMTCICLNLVSRFMISSMCFPAEQSRNGDTEKRCTFVTLPTSPRPQDTTQDCLNNACMGDTEPKPTFIY